MIDPVHPFWRKEPLTAAEQELLVELFRAHAISARRDNLSTHAVVSSAIGAADYGKAIAAGLMTLGSLHGPIPQAYQLLSLPHPERHAARICGKWKVAGWGTSFVKGKPDPDWENVCLLLREYPVWTKIEAISRTLWDHGKMIYPNPGGLTASVALVLKMPAHVAPYLFLAGRLNVWSELFMKNSTHDKVW